MDQPEEFQARPPIRRPDVLARNCGSTWAFTPITNAARLFFDENISSEPWQWLGASLVVDHRFALDLIAILCDAGLAVG